MDFRQQTHIPARMKTTATAEPSVMASNSSPCATVACKDLVFLSAAKVASCSIFISDVFVLCIQS